MTLLLSSTPAQSGLDGDGWVSGIILTDADTAAANVERTRVLAERARRRDDPKNPRVFMDIEIEGKPAGRVRKRHPALFL